MIFAFTQSNKYYCCIGVLGTSYQRRKVHIKTMILTLSSCVYKPYSLPPLVLSVFKRRLETTFHTLVPCRIVSFYSCDREVPRNNTSR